MKKGLNISGQRVLILGAGESGQAAAELCVKLGAEPVFMDGIRCKTEDGRSSAARRAPDNASRFPPDPPDNNFQLSTFNFQLAPPDNASHFSLLNSQFPLAIISPGIPPNAPHVRELRNRGIKIVSELEFAYRQCAAPVLAVTGTNGKTTTVTLLGAILKRGGVRAEVLGNIGTAFSRRALELKRGGRAVLEVSSFQAEAAETFRPRVGVILNITPDHLDRHGNMENYAAAKFKMLSRQRKTDFAVLNADDPEIMKRADSVRAQIYFFSLNKKVKGCYIEGGGVWFWGGEGEPRWIVSRERIKLPGRHNAANAAAAACAALLYGAGDNAVAAALAEFTGAKHRLEFVREVNGVKYYDDSKATNIGGALAGAWALSGEVTIILGGSGKGYEFDELFEGLPANVTRAVAVGAAADKIMAAAARRGYGGIVAAPDFRSAVEAARRLTVPGGSVLLSPACASFDMFRDYAHRGEAFCGIVEGFRELRIEN
ncbi:MAG: UDP-N-acetylmuramoyl-L-alanine--D-glutamate ligase [Clostridiales bacterium]|jgi:UDP-N-acetylmuramoylalanine--D-glutamate ligase|nr:UDP-N-acetylmuramoyl-L-alanine--D-glutamate ligase [Clostridiales bacterium]